MNSINLPEATAYILKNFFQNKINEGYLFEASHPYFRMDGKFIYLRMRLKNNEGKKCIKPFYYDQRWRMSEPKFDGKKPLYGLQNLKDSTELPLFIVEGENKVDLLGRLGVHAVTSGSSSSAESADWSPLKGRKIIIWLDNDEAGMQYAHKVTSALKSLNCSISWIDLSKLDLPDKGDAVDWRKKNPAATSEEVYRLETIQPPPTPANEIEKSDSISYRLASNIQVKPINWLWEKRFARGKLSIISGDPGVGKSQLTAYMASVITHGSKWPDGANCTQGRAVFLSAEDTPEDTMVPRLMASGADLGRVIIIDSVNKKDKDGNAEEHFFDINNDLPALEKLLSDFPDITTIIIDPITAYLGDTDDNRNTRVRAILAPLSSLAELYDVAVICISHNNKNNQQDAIHRVAGSIGYVAASRAVFIVTKDKENDQKRLFLPLKNNIGNDRTGLSYSIEETALESGIVTSRVIWDDDPVTISATDALSQTKQCQGSSALEEAKKFLNSLLANGPVNAGIVSDKAKLANIATATLNRASKQLGVISRKKRGTAYAPWFWFLKEHREQFEQMHQDKSWVS